MMACTHFGSIGHTCRAGRGGEARPNSQSATVSGAGKCQCTQEVHLGIALHQGCSPAAGSTVADLAEVHPASGHKLVIDNPLGQQAVVISRHAGAAGVQLQEDSGEGGGQGGRGAGLFLSCVFWQAVLWTAGAACPSALAAGSCMLPQPSSSRLPGPGTRFLPVCGSRCAWACGAPGGWQTLGEGAAWGSMGQDSVSHHMPGTQFVEERTHMRPSRRRPIVLEQDRREREGALTYRQRHAQGDHGGGIAEPPPLALAAAAALLLLPFPFPFPRPLVPTAIPVPVSISALRRGLLIPPGGVASSAGAAALPLPLDRALLPGLPPLPPPPLAAAAAGVKAAAVGAQNALQLLPDVSRKTHAAPVHSNVSAPVNGLPRLLPGLQQQATPGSSRQRQAPVQLLAANGIHVRRQRPAHSKAGAAPGIFMQPGATQPATPANPPTHPPTQPAIPTRPPAHPPTHTPTHPPRRA